MGTTLLKPSEWPCFSWLGEMKFLTELQRKFWTMQLGINWLFSSASFCTEFRKIEHTDTEHRYQKGQNNAKSWTGQLIPVKNKGIL